MTGILGKKIGMTQVYTDDGRMICVTAVQAGPCPVLAVKDKSIQIGFEQLKESRVNKPAKGYFKKLNIAPLRVIGEIKKELNKEYKIGEELKADIFNIGDFVDVTGTTIGKGFQGGMKRWNWAGGGMSHGSTSHRRVGSIGSTTTPGRVFRGHHMPGHMGMCKLTVQNLEVIKVDAANNLLLIKGAIPGHKNNYVIIKKAIKKIAKANKPQPQAQAKSQAQAKPQAKAKK